LISTELRLTRPRNQIYVLSVSFLNAHNRVGLLYINSNLLPMHSNLHAFITRKNCNTIRFNSTSFLDLFINSNLQLIIRDCGQLCINKASDDVMRVVWNELIRLGFHKIVGVVQ
jgi:hypothetical protein